jgi:predicted AAA+ superfamily ATPase
MPGLTKTIAEQVNVRLSLGFYKEDVAAYFAAADVKWAEDQASSDPATKDRVAKVIANLRGGREGSAAHYNVNYPMPEAFRTV